VYPIEDVMAEVIAHVKAQQKQAAFQALLTPMLANKRNARQAQAAIDLMTLVIATKDATLDGQREALFERLAELGYPNAKLPVDSTVKNALKDYRLKPCSKARVSYDRPLLETDFDDAFLAAFRTEVALDNLKSGAFFIAIDGTGRPFFGASHRYGKKAPKRPKHEMTEAGQDAVPAFKGAKNGTRGSPEHRGTVNKHAYAHLSAFLYGTKESFPLSIRCGRITADVMDAFIDQLDRLPVQPAFVFADKEFCNHPKSEKLREYCDTKRIGMLIAYPKDEAIRKMVWRDWHENRTKPVEGADEVAFWSMNRHKRRSGGRPCNVLTLFFTRDPRKDISNDGHEILRLPDGMYAVSFYTNVGLNVESDEIWLLYKQYSLRWSVECLLKRWKAYCGRSGSSAMFLRDYIHMASMLMLAGYALWRMERARRAGLKPGHRLISHTRYFGAIAEDCRDRLKAPTLAKPPMPVLHPPPSRLPPSP
jgi:hypothetical protein